MGDSTKKSHIFDFKTSRDESYFLIFFFHGIDYPHTPEYVNNIRLNSLSKGRGQLHLKAVDQVGGM